MREKCGETSGVDGLQKVHICSFHSLSFRNISQLEMALWPRRKRECFVKPWDGCAGNMDGILAPYFQDNLLETRSNENWMLHLDQDLSVAMG